MKKLGLAACAAIALTATSASANGYWQNGSYYAYPTATTQSYSNQTYTAPSTTVVGTVGPVQTATTPAYIQPSTYTSTYSQPTATYTAPTTVYTVPDRATTSTYVAPAQPYAYAPPATTVYAPAPIYVVPQRVQPQYDGRDRVRNRLQNQRRRIERALDRGELRRGEERRLRQGLREIRHTFRAYRDNDGYVGRHEEAALMEMLDRNGRRIRRLANNDRVAGQRRRYDY